MTRRIFIVAGVILLAVAGLAVSVGIAYLGAAPAKDGMALPGNARLVRDGFVNLYVLPAGAGRVVLVDCGSNEKAEALAAVLKTQGLGLEAVEAVLITHAHPDHIGGCKALPDARLYALNAEADAVEGTAVLSNFVSRVTMAKPSPTGLRVAERVSDRQTLHIDGIDVKVFALPGHTPGSAAYLINGVLYVGDGAMATNKGGLKGGPWIFNTDGRQAAASIKALAARLAQEKIVVQQIATGHTGPAPASALTAGN